MPDGTTPPASNSALSQSAFSHSAFLHDSDTAYTELLVPFLCEGLELGEEVAVATGPRHTGLLRTALGPDAERVRFLSADEWFVRPAHTIGAWSQLVRSAAKAGRPAIRVVNEIPYGTAAALPWFRFEAALNAALADHSAHVLCPYDRSVLPSSVAAMARRTHHRVHDTRWHRSDDYRRPEELLPDLPEPPYPVSGAPVLRAPILDTVLDLRAMVRDRALAERWLSPQRVESLILALSETTTNAIRHGGPNRLLTVWLNPEAVVCEVTDDGAVPPGPLAGYLPPRPGVVGGMGLWLVGQVSDAFTLEIGPTRARFALLR